MRHKIVHEPKAEKLVWSFSGWVRRDEVGVEEMRVGILFRGWYEVAIQGDLAKPALRWS